MDMTRTNRGHAFLPISDEECSESGDSESGDSETGDAETGDAETGDSETGEGIDLDETGNYTGSNVSRPPRQHEMPKPNNPAGGNSSNSQNNSTPIKN